MTMCETVARKMLATLNSCKLYDKARSELERLAARNDCEGMRDYVVDKTAKYPSVDREMRGHGLKPLAAVKAEIEQLYEEHVWAAHNR